jgi:hypothetical protein
MESSLKVDDLFGSSPTKELPLPPVTDESQVPVMKSN